MNADPIRAISLRQPWASLLFVIAAERNGQRCGHHGTELERPIGGHRTDRTLDHIKWACRDCFSRELKFAPPLKQWETRSRPAPSTIIGERILVHAAKRPPVSIYEADLVAARDMDGDYCLWQDGVPVCDLPLGVLLGWATITESLPIVEDQEETGSAYEGPACVESRPDNGHLMYWPSWDGALEYEDGTDMADQLPFGDWTPGRHAWRVTDPVLLDEPIPYRGQQGVFFVDPEVLSR